MRPSLVSSMLATLASLTSPLPGKAGAVPSQRYADSAGNAVARSAPVPTGSRQCSHALVLGRLGGALEDLLAADTFTQDLAGRGLVAFLVDPAPAQLERRHVECLGDAVDLHLRGELRLGSAETAERAVRRCVGGHRAALDAHVGTQVRAARVERAA